MNYLLGALIGLIGGLTSGLFGVGGGIIIVPALVMLMHTDMKSAVATSLAVIVPTTLASSVLNHSYGRIDWRLVAAGWFSFVEYQFDAIAGGVVEKYLAPAGRGHFRGPK